MYFLTQIVQLMVMYIQGMHAVREQATRPPDNII